MKGLWRVTPRVVVVVGMLLLGFSAVPASAAQVANDRVSIFAPIGNHGTGVTAHGGLVYVSTSNAMPLGKPRTDDEHVFTYDAHGRRIHTLNVDMGPSSIMGLGNISFDGRDRMYVSDMKGEVLRFASDGSSMHVFRSPLPYNCGNWTTSMIQGIVFDRSGNGYIPDGGGRIWRVTPAGVRTLWFTDQRLFGAAGGGMFQAQIDAAGEWLYFVNVMSFEPDMVGGSTLYRLRVKDHPGSADLERLHSWAPDQNDVAALVGEHPFFGPETNGIALAKSGRIYVTESGHNQIDVLDAHGKLERTIVSPLFNYPVALTFLGTDLLTVNMDLHGADRPDRPKTWNVLRVEVGDEGVAPFLPTNIP